ncbi:MAG: hypothetical protein IJR83_03020 [Clostridia bacterium]|nr:hypothetical protein [Clostridia bacterium]
MKTIIRIPALLLALVLIAAAMLACGTPQKPAETTDTNTESETEKQSAGSETQPGSETETDTETDPGAGHAEEPVSLHFDFDTFHIGTYVMGPHTKENVDDMKKAGIDYIIDGGFSEELLDYIDSKGMGVFLTGAVPGWWGDGGQNAGQLQYSQANSLENYAAAAGAVADHPAIWAIDVGDEPSALDLEYYGQICKTVFDSTGGKYFAYLNLYPGYASTTETSKEEYSQLGVATFREYIEEFVRCVDVPYVCFDHYFYGGYTSNDPANCAQFYCDLRDVADICRENGRHFMIVLQVNTNDTNLNNHMADFNLRFQAYMSMAYGADQICWACWSPGWWYNNVLDESGQKTQQYDILKKVNKELHSVGKVLQNYTNTGTSLVGFKEGSRAYEHIAETTTEGRPTPMDTIVESVSSGRFSNVTCEDGFSMAVGTMVSKADNGSEALMIADATDAYGLHNAYDVSFAVSGEGTVTAYCGNKKTVLTKSSDGLYHYSLEACQGVLITVN